MGELGRATRSNSADGDGAEEAAREGTGRGQGEEVLEGVELPLHTASFDQLASASAEAIENQYATFERRSLVPLLHPSFSRASGHSLSYKSPYARFRWPAGAVPRRFTVLDVAQNAGCLIFGHAPSAAVSATLQHLESRTPLRLPLAKPSVAEVELKSKMVRLASEPTDESDGCNDNAAVPPASIGWWSGYTCVQQDCADDTAMPRDGRSRSLFIITLHGGFHGNCTRAAFSASEVFRQSKAASVLVDMCVVGLAANATPEDVEGAFKSHDDGSSLCVAVLVEPVQHHSRLVRMESQTAAALNIAASRRGVPLISDEIWSGIYRTGDFLASRRAGLRPQVHHASQSTVPAGWTKQPHRDDAAAPRVCDVAEPYLPRVLADRTVPIVPIAPR
eukprot:scaffold30546_cov34-Tisochrysis_lutea.AAC.5